MVRRGYRVRALVLYNSFDSWGWLDALPPDIMANVEVVLGDVRDAASVRELAAGAADASGTSVSRTVSNFQWPARFTWTAR